MRNYKFRINSNSYDVTVKDFSTTKATVEVNGQTHHVDIDEIKNLLTNQVAKESNTVFKPAARPARSASAPVVAPTAAPAVSSGKAVVAPIPGQIKEVCVKVGDQIQAGQKILVMEAMKMENVINSTFSGKVAAILVSEGDNVGQDQALIEIGG
ncbi:MAG: acetyl-CoA carboxylase biotin carboxyl carrier protein subunit [Bacteriovoracaceae bacterium]|nr:acetyl-CoA carboxylase biotin carboxyl carrier protein subunit [Bacteriovoracaceae bacterium]